MAASYRSRLCRPFIRAYAAWVFRPAVPIATQRQRLTAFGSFPPYGVRRAPFQADGVGGVWLRPRAETRQRVILYLHGGGYCLGTPRMYADLVGRIAAVTGACVLLLDYGLAPEHPFPTALTDAYAAYRWLRARTPASAAIALVGDSAGGGLALALALLLRDHGAPLPAALAILSAWTDLACTGASLHTRAHADPLFTPGYVRQMARFYPGAANPRMPLVSPLYADLYGLPPLLVQVGSDEILLDDSVRLAARARRAGVAVTLHVWPGMWHGWQLAARVVPEGRQAIDQIGAFVRHHTAGTRNAHPEEPHGH